MRADLVAWQLAQYVGRLHREHHAKREVVVNDYVDSSVPLLARMALKRQSGHPQPALRDRARPLRAPLD